MKRKLLGASSRICKDFAFKTLMIFFAVILIKAPSQYVESSLFLSQSIIQSPHYKLVEYSQPFWYMKLNQGTLLSIIGLFWSITSLPHSMLLIMMPERVELKTLLLPATPVSLFDKVVLKIGGHYIESDELHHFLNWSMHCWKPIINFINSSQLLQFLKSNPAITEALKKLIDYNYLFDDISNNDGCGHCDDSSFSF